MLEFLKCGAAKKFIVIKIDDLKKYVNSVFKLAMLENDLNDIQAGRKADGKKPCPEYLVISTDEPYAGEIIEIMKRNGHWGESPDHIDIETCNACEKEYNPKYSDGIVNGHPFCQNCIVGMAEESVTICDKLSEVLELLKEFAFYCVDETNEEHGDRAGRVQDFLLTTSLKDWMEEQLRLSKCENCDDYDRCENQDGNCSVRRTKDMKR